MTRESPLLWFVVPALNESGSLPHLARTITSACASIDRRFRMVVVDDGSTDGTAEAAIESFGAERCSVVRFETNRGPGAAVDAGLRKVLELAGDEDFVVTLEADGTSDLGILSDLLALVEKDRDIALASPFAQGGGVVGTGWHRHFLSWAANLLTEACLGIHGVSTYSSFYRVHRKEILERVYGRYGDRTIEERGFAYAVEILTKTIRVGARVAEVPMVLDATQRIGKSRMRIARTVARYIVLFARLGLRRKAPDA